MTVTKERSREATATRTAPPHEQDRTEKARPTDEAKPKEPHTLDNDGGPAPARHLFENTLDF